MKYEVVRQEGHSPNYRISRVDGKSGVLAWTITREDAQVVAWAMNAQAEEVEKLFTKLENDSLKQGEAS